MRWPDTRRWDWATVALWGPVVAVAALAQSGLGLEEPWTGSDLSLAATSLMLAVPLIIRRSRPLATAALMAGALVAQDALGDSLSFASFVAVLVTAYCTGRYLPGRLTAVGCLMILAGVLVAMRSSLPEAVDELVFPVFYVSAAGVIGHVVRRLATQAAELRRLNDALAAERDASARLAVATERIRLARDLHDTVAHTLTVVVVQAENCEEALVGEDPARARAAASAVQAAGRRGLADLRSTVRVLRQADEVDPAPRLGDIETLATAMAGAGLEVSVRRQGDLSTVPDDVGQQVTRVVQEALTNVVRHSAAGTATVRLLASADGVEVTVDDPGPPLDSGLPAGGHGVIGMTERLAPYGGTLTVGPHSDGFRVHARVPTHPGHTR